MSNIVVFKMISGQEIIGKQVEGKKSALLLEQRVSTPESSDEVYLEDVRVIEFGPGPNGQIQVGLFPWMISATDSTITVKKSAIIASVEAERVPKQMLDMYLSNTSGLQIANAGAIK